MTETPLRFATLSLDQVREAADLAAAEGWNPGLHDAETFYAADPKAFFGAFLGDTLVACISITVYSPRYAFLGFYICKPPYRGQGVGYALWRWSLEQIEAEAVGLDGVVEQQWNYAKSGFVYAYASHRYGGTPTLTGDPGAASPLTAVDREALEAYDSAVFGMARPRFLNAWLTQPEALTRCVVQDGALRGYGLLRPCLEGAKIGPLFADDLETARTLLAALAAETPGPIFLDVPAPNEPGAALAREAGLTPVFETARMIRGPELAVDLQRTFGVTTFEFG